MIIAIVKATILDGKHAQLRKIADILQYQYAAHEEGCEQYESFIDQDTFITIERWSSEVRFELKRPDNALQATCEDARD